LGLPNRIENHSHRGFIGGTGMKAFPRVFKYRGFEIHKTSFSWHVRGGKLDEIVETYQDGKDMIDKAIREGDLGG
jgi:hypothetical protein